MRKAPFWEIHDPVLGHVGRTLSKSHAEKRRSEGMIIREGVHESAKKRKPASGPDMYHRQSSGRFAGGKLDRELASLKDWGKKL